MAEPAGSSSTEMEIPAASKAAEERIKYLPSELLQPLLLLPGVISPAMPRLPCLSPVQREGTEKILSPWLLLCSRLA